MQFEQFRRDIKGEVFDYQVLAEHLKNLSKPRDKVTALISEGKIVRLKKGLYVFGELWRKNPLYLEEVANLIYGPSCVSFEYALNSYGLIAERSSVVTSLTIGDSKTFHTPIGVFEYRAIDEKKFKVGIEYRRIENEGGYFIASKEKALVDFVYRTPGIRSLEQLRYFLFEEMRVDETLFRSFDFNKLAEIGEIYGKNGCRMVSNL